MPVQEPDRAFGALHLLLALPGRCHLGPDLGRAAGIPVLVTQALEDPLGRVALLGRGVTVRRQDLVDDTQELAQLRLRAGRALAIAGGFGVGQDLLQGLRADPVVPSDRALRRALHQYPAPDLRPHLHVGVHPSPVHSLDPQTRSLWMGSSDHGDGQVLQVSISVYTVQMNAATWR